MAALSSLLGEDVASFGDLYQDAGSVLLALGHPALALPFFRWAVLGA